MKNILVPIDFSEQSEHAFNFATQLCLRTGSKLTLLHAVDTAHFFNSLYMDPQLAGQLLKDMETKSEERLAGFKEIIKPLGIKTDIVAKRAPVPDAIAEIAQAQDADLIVMGTKGASGLKELLVGSNTERVLRLTKIPVIAIPKKVQLEDIKRIVIPLHYDMVTERFMSELMLLQKIFGASLEFLWVKTQHDLCDDEFIQANFEHYLRRRFNESHPLHLERDIMPESAILRFVSEIDGNMIAMATSQKKGLEHLFLGSTTEDIVNHSSTPVWGFPQGEHSAIDFRKEQPKEFGEFIL